MMPAAWTDPLSGLPDGFWETVRTTPHRILMLDYDGTLAPFRIRRDTARASRPTQDLIMRIATSGTTTTAVISGRPLADLRSLIGSLPVILVGEHGWEVRLPDGDLERHPIPPACANLLDRAAALGKVAAWSRRVERKRSALVLHTRGLSRARAGDLLGKVRDAWSPLATSRDLRLETFDGGLELRAALRDKGLAVRDLVAKAPSESLAVYLGDDVTDEDAFGALGATGVGIRVGPGDRPSRATGRLPGVAAVDRFLERWLEIVATPSSHRDPLEATCADS